MAFVAWKGVWCLVSGHYLQCSDSVEDYKIDEVTCQVCGAFCYHRYPTELGMRWAGNGVRRSIHADGEGEEDHVQLIESS